MYIFIFLSVSIYAQFRIVNFNLFQVGTNVLIKFTVTAGSICNGYTVYHCLDSVSFVPVYDYAGVCGTSSSDENFSYTHTGATPDKINYYKVQLSTVETSGIRRIYVPSNSRSGIIAYPNPILNTSDSLKLRLFNTNNLQLVGFIYSPSGKPRQELHLKAKGELTALDVNNFENGVYVVWLTDGYQAYSSKFIINRQ